ncbi:hypothetical protein Scep_009614 [Stephania cephalantha]|uniref:Uncharacterized protein n=1 Tax=Stephania cephalantha TaxID=152367 RepID=A0AAP0JTH8_9MAGN
MISATIIFVEPMPNNDLPILSDALTDICNPKVLKFPNMTIPYQLYSLYRVNLYYQFSNSFFPGYLKAISDSP